MRLRELVKDFKRVSWCGKREQNPYIEKYWAQAANYLLELARLRKANKVPSLLEQLLELNDYIRLHKVSCSDIYPQYRYCVVVDRKDPTPEPDSDLEMYIYGATAEEAITKAIQYLK